MCLLLLLRQIIIVTVVNSKSNVFKCLLTTHLNTLNVFSMASKTVSQSVFINGDIYRINKLATTDKALYRFYVADKSILPIYLRELS